MFLFSQFLKHSPSINRLLHINFDTSDALMQHLCIATPKYGGLYRTFYDIRKAQFLSIFLVCKKVVFFSKGAVPLPQSYHILYHFQALFCFLTTSIYLLKYAQSV